MSFGERFGDLVRKKRAVEGLTQQALAVRAFGDEGSRTRISELENGRVSKPHAKTVDALVVGLGINESELTGLLRSSPYPGYLDKLVDFFEVRPEQKLNAGVVIKADQSVALMYDQALKFPLKRVEYFKTDRVMVLTTLDERRRPFGVSVHQAVDRHIMKQEFVALTRVVLGEALEIVKETVEDTVALAIIEVK